MPDNKQIHLCFVRVVLHEFLVMWCRDFCNPIRFPVLWKDSKNIQGYVADKSATLGRPSVDSSKHNGIAGKQEPYV